MEDIWPTEDALKNLFVDYLSSLLPSRQQGKSITSLALPYLSPQTTIHINTDINRGNIRIILYDISNINTSFPKKLG